MTKKNNSGAGKFFLGAALGAALGAIASKFIKVDLAEEDAADTPQTDDQCQSSADTCCCKESKPAKTTAQAKSEPSSEKKTKAK